jgi:LAO/AO transport system kinase
VVGISSINGQGFDELLATIGRHRDVSQDAEFGRRRRTRVAQFRLEKTAETLLLQHFHKAAAGLAPELALKLAEREGDPYSLASELVAAALNREVSHERA